jgi:hypothetical protein
MWMSCDRETLDEGGMVEIVAVLLLVQQKVMVALPTIVVL